MDISLKTLEEALAVRRQIDSLQKCLSAILEGAAPRPTGPTQGGRYFSPALELNFLLPPSSLGKIKGHEETSRC
jgi:hypothetical protein